MGKIKYAKHSAEFRAEALGRRDEDEYAAA
jgi:hypothetical protein